jgi:hypothetical protein
LGVLQALRLGIPPMERSQPARTPLQLYFEVGHLSLNYIVAAFGQLALLIVCFYVDWEQLGRKGVLRL